jgi:hypothetical protein
MQRLYSFFSQFWGSPLLLHILLAFRLYFPSDPPFHIIWLCLSSFSVVLQYLIGKLVRLLRYLLLFKFSSHNSILFRSTPGAVTAPSEKSPQDQVAASYHVLQKIDAQDRLVVRNKLFCLLSALTFESLAVTFADGFQFKSREFFSVGNIFLNRKNTFVFVVKQQLFSSLMYE